MTKVLPVLISQGEAATQFPLGPPETPGLGLPVFSVGAGWEAGSDSGELHIQEVHWGRI